MPRDVTNHRPATTQTSEFLATPSLDWREAATAVQANRDSHDRLMAQSGLFDSVRVFQAGQRQQASNVLRVAAWNLERCKNVEGAAALLSQAKADICLLSEMDLGMARAGNRDTTADLAEALGMNHAFGVEFIELGLGDQREQADHVGQQNSAGLHGNAVLTGLPSDRAAILPLDAGGAWFNDAGGNDQRRIGGRMAIAQRLALPQPLWVVAVHYESRRGPEDRAQETRILLDHITALCGDDRVLIGGDFNCKEVTLSGLRGTDVLERPGSAEPMFDLFAEAGFDWRSCNTTQATTRSHPWTPPEKSPHKIDWFFARGLTCRNPAVAEAVAADGTNLSDHEAIFIEIALSA